jgi:hypothetical protein
MDITRGQAKAVKIIKSSPAEKQAIALKSAGISETDIKWAKDFISKY